MELMRSIRKRLSGLLGNDAPASVPTMRARPGQAMEKAMFMYAPSPDFDYHMAAYAFREWISIAINRMAVEAMSAPIIVRSRGGDRVLDNHPLLDLIGMYGQPNDVQDTLEYLEGHFQQYDIFGNSIWYWESSGGVGGYPDSVWRLDPDRIQVIPGARRTIEKYRYQVGGEYHDMMPNEITHFKKANPLKNGVYWGLSAIDTLRNTISSDRAMTHWNIEGFDTGAPSGILIVDADSVSADEAKRMEYEIHEQVRDKRKMIVIRAKPGSAVWNEAMLKQRDMEFQEGRLLHRQTAFDAFGFHVGLVSEASTEAHAKVAERRVLHSVHHRHIRTASQLNRVLGYWGDSSKLEVVFKDVRQVDWQQESLKLKAVQPYMDRDEVRSEYLSLPNAGKDYQEDGRIKRLSRANGGSRVSEGGDREAVEVQDNDGATAEAV